MAGSESFECSEYVKSLEPVGRKRYQRYPLHCKIRCEEELRKWQDLTVVCLMESPGMYTKESLKADKSLEANEYLVTVHEKKKYIYIYNTAPYSAF